MNQAGPRMYPGFIPLISQASVWYDGQDLNKVSYSGGLCSRFCASSRGKLTKASLECPVPTQVESFSLELVPTESLKPRLCFCMQESERLELMNAELKTQIEELKQERQQLILMLNRHRPTCIVRTDSVKTPESESNPLLEQLEKK